MVVPLIQKVLMTDKNPNPALKATRRCAARALALRWNPNRA
mgnify:CR=1 FL=1